MTRNKIHTQIRAALLAVSIAALAAIAADRYPAQDAVVNASETPVVSDPAASDGQYVQMRSGNLRFNVIAPSAGFYTILARFSQTCDDSKIQNLVVNGTSAGQLTFAGTGPYNGSECGPAAFAEAKIAGKVKLNAGANTVEITNSWGWVDIDYIEVEPYAEEPFNIPTALATPNASANARKMYQFMRENFTKKIISGVMSGYSMESNNKAAYTITTLPEMKHVYDQSGKYPALLGLDFFHGTGKEFQDAGGDKVGPNESYFVQYNNTTLALAEELFNAGGIPHYMWHWRDPMKKTKEFYTSTGSSTSTDFDIASALNAQGTWNTSSAAYDSLIADIDRVAGYLKILADKDVAVLWRPLHEAAGGWFWWGRDKKPAPLKALWKLMFERMVNHHKLNNLIWVWTCEEGNALDWYPGDEYVDIVGRDYYHWPDAQNKQVYSSLVSNFESLKSIYNASKIIALSENGTVPHPDSMATDGAWWSFFMSWNQEFLRIANPNAHWNAVMKHDKVITLDQMPGWGSYQLTNINAPKNARPKPAASPSFTAKSRKGFLELNIKGTYAQKIELFNLRGSKIAVLSRDRLSAGTYKLPVKNAAGQMCIVRIKTADNKTMALPVRIE
jgi:mannan endo-1,4-beta-mannosidase